MSTRATITAAAVVSLTLAGCAAAEPQAASPSAEPATAVPRTSSSPSASSSEIPAVDAVVLRFTSQRTSVDVTVTDDTPTIRDLMSRLPLTLEIEEFAGREKVAYLSEELTVAGTPGSDPEDGVLIYYVPWGNLGFYYDASGIEYSDQTLHLGTFDADRSQLDLLEGSPVTVERVA